MSAVLVLTSAFLARAADDSDIALARSLLEPGFDLEGVQVARLEGPPYVTDWWQEPERSNLQLRDLNKDGHKDVFMVVEENPRLRDKKGAPCKEYGRTEGCSIDYGERYVQVYYGQADGPYKRAINSAPLLGRGDGGMDPDAYKWSSVTPQGSIQIHFSGGSGWKWGYVYTFQYRQDDIYSCIASCV